MTGTTQGGRKAAATRGYDELSAAGRKGGQQASYQGSRSHNHNKSSTASGKGGSCSRKNDESE